MTENKITVFENTEFGKVRTLDIDDSPWFVGKDVAEILMYKNTKDAISRHVDEEDKRIIQMLENATLENHIPKSVLPMDFERVDIPNRGLTIINEFGLYSLILSSKLPNAKGFKHWITSEVLPTIRKTGGYVSNDDIFVNTYLPFADDSTKMLFKATLQTINDLNRVVRKQNEKISADEPYVNFAKHVTESSDTVDVGKFSKIVKMNILILDEAGCLSGLDGINFS